MRILSALFLTLAATANGLSAADTAALPQAISPTDDHLHYSGRWERSDAKGPRCEWPAGAIHLNFSGSAMTIELGGSKGHALQVVVDGKPTSVITLVDGQSVYPVVADLPAGPHAIELCKRTECWGGPIQVRGLQLSQDGKLLDPPKFERRIEFLGDSITCGYGNEAASEKEHFSYATENAWLAWGAVTARALHAEYSCEAVSGIWLQDNGKKKALPAIWDHTMPFSSPTIWDFSRWQADVVVVNLGTNDSGAKVIDEASWTAAYRGFITQIRKAYPQAHIFLTIGSMGHGPQNVIPQYNTKLVAALTAEGETKVHAVALSNQNPKNGLGADWHPSVKTHQIMADEIVAAIKPVLGW